MVELQQQQLQQAGVKQEMPHSDVAAAAMAAAGSAEGPGASGTTDSGEAAPSASSKVGGWADASLGATCGCAHAWLSLPRCRPAGRPSLAANGCKLRQWPDALCLHRFAASHLSACSARTTLAEAAPRAEGNGGSGF